MEDGSFLKLSARQKKWMELRAKMVLNDENYCVYITFIYWNKIKIFALFSCQQEAKKRNQIEIANEKKRMEPPTESRGVSKQKWLEDRKRKIGKLLDANGLDMTKAYMLDTQEAAEVKYKKWEKDPAPFGWDGMFSIYVQEMLLHNQYVNFLVGLIIYVLAQSISMLLF
jgi:pre-mRNA-splicing factor SYF2